MVSRLGSYRASTGLAVSSLLTLLKESLCGSPHTHAFSFTNSSRIGWVICDRLGENLLSWLTKPRKRRISLTLVGVANFAIAETLSGSAVIPRPSITCPKYSTDGWANVHFSEFSVSQYHSAAAEPVSIGRRALLVSSRGRGYHK